MRLGWLVTIPLVITQACEAKTHDLREDQRAAVVAAVDSALKAFEAAQRARNADGAVALMAPDFFMYTDGVRQGYDSVAQSVRQSFASFQHVDPGFRDIHIRVLSATSALTSFRFRDSLVTTSGLTLRFAGATTLLWELREGRWLMTYGHADHRPVE